MMDTRIIVDESCDKLAKISQSDIYIKFTHSFRTLETRAFPSFLTTLLVSTIIYNVSMLLHKIEKYSRPFKCTESNLCLYKPPATITERCFPFSIFNVFSFTIFSVFHFFLSYSLHPRIYIIYVQCYMQSEIIIYCQKDCCKGKSYVKQCTR